MGFSSVSTVTTATPTTAFRGAGRPEAAVAIERAMDRFAAEIGMDPAELRRRNLVPRFLEGYTTGIGTYYDVGDYPEALRRALEHAGYDELRAEQAARRAAGGAVQMGIGLSSYVEITAGGPSSEYGSVELLDDGRIRVTHRGHALRPGPRDGVGDDRGRPDRRGRWTTSRSSRATPTWCPSAASPSARGRSSWPAPRWPTRRRS